MVAFGTFTIPAEHPSLPGHFPGRPIVPGVVLLDHALALLAAGLPGRDTSRLAAVKFAAGVVPGQRVEVWRADPGPRGQIDFQARVGGREVLRGSILPVPP